MNLAAVNEELRRRREVEAAERQEYMSWLSRQRSAQLLAGWPQRRSRLESARSSAAAEEERCRGVCASLAGEAAPSKRSEKKALAVSRARATSALARAAVARERAVIMLASVTEDMQRLAALPDAHADALAEALVEAPAEAEAEELEAPAEAEAVARAEAEAVAPAEAEAVARAEELEVRAEAEADARANADEVEGQEDAAAPVRAPSGIAYARLFRHKGTKNKARRP